MAAIRLGTSGWSYDEWVGAFYPSGEVNKLTFYTNVFETVEIDSTFYSYPSRGLVYGWAKYSRPRFIFSAKLPSVITHEKMLRVEDGVESDLSRFIDLMKPLIDRRKMGPLLIQLPPSFTKDYERLEAFLNILPQHVRFAVEFRHPSWWSDETWSLLKRYQVAYTIVDEPLLPSETVVTAEFAVIRWHGRGRRPWYNYRYSRGELEPWVQKLKGLSKEVDEVYGYFNNHFHGYAVENCLQLLEMLGLITDEQREVKRSVENYLNTKLAKAAEPPTQKISEGITLDMKLEDLLSALTPSQKLSRAREIGDEEIKALQVLEGTIKAEIRGYHILIDADRRLILHDCADWARCAPNKTFCKHLAKILLTIPRDEATSTLRRILSEKDEWQFKLLSG